MTDDSLWDLGTKPALPTFTLPIPLHPLVNPPQAEAGPSQSTSLGTAVTDGVADLSLADSDAAASAMPPYARLLSASDVSTLLTRALLQALSSDSSSSISFPIPASQLYSGYILPNRPAYIPALQRDDVVIGKSDWKKLGKWMKEASKDGLIKTKESKGEMMVQGSVFRIQFVSVLNAALMPGTPASYRTRAS